MSMATHEQRLQALAAAVADLRSQQSARQTDRSGGPLDGLPPGADQPLVPGVPPKNAVRLRARLAGVEPAPQDLGLSQTEWAALNLVVTRFAMQSGSRFRLRSPYREHLAQGFARYFVRVGLPHDANAFEQEGGVMLLAEQPGEDAPNVRMQLTGDRG